MIDRGATRSAVGREETGAGRWLGLALALLALVLVLAVVRTRPLEPKPQDVPLTEFSAVRAREVLRTLLIDGSPHPTGSAMNARVRERILTHLRWMGLTPEVEEGFACSDLGNCARVFNVVARLEGTQPGKAVVLMAHYDSVPAGPGVADDMAGVAAILETARALKAGPPPRSPVILLLTDGEEAGLLGVRAFAEQSPRMEQVGAVVNLEARGSSGPSLLFETSGADGWMIPRYAGGAERPLSSSVFATIYDRLPNDTDLTVFKSRGVPGLNFAFIRNPLHYHTPEDNLENLSSASLQHHGDNALAAVRGLSGADLASPPPGRAVFFDLLGFFVVRWPAGWTLLLAGLALVAVIAAVVLAHRRGVFAGASLGGGLLAFLLGVVLAAVAAFALQTLLRGAFPAVWAANPLPAKVAFWLLPLAAVLAAAAWLSRARSAGLWAGVWLAWGVVGLLLAILAPGVSYLFLVPALVAGVAGLALLGSPSGRALASFLPALAGGLLWFPILLALYDGLGLGGLFVTGVLVGLFATTLAPLVALADRAWRRWAPVAIAALAVVFAVVAMSTAPFSPQAPRPLPLQYHFDADTGLARWIAFAGGRPLPEPLRRAVPFAQEPVRPFPWSAPQARALAASAPALALSAPELTVLESSVEAGKRRVRLRLASPRGAHVGFVLIPAGAKLESIRMQGKKMPLRGAGQGGQWRTYNHLSLPPEGGELEVVLGETAPLDWYVGDRTYGLPPVGQALQEARPASATTIQLGDTTTVTRKVRI
ncbi:MAG TPA: M20/M25/M40 family metallo-hydrolase [Thermoanaerobaculia bacterium]|nr:M20/M25/M40 family metallo-hydrolase [Thermoanaerobaculia bacterium]